MSCGYYSIRDGQSDWELGMSEAPSPKGIHVLKGYSEYVVWVPVIGILLGFLFNVGYFAAFGLGFFGVFSLSEHVVFAFQALPFALALMLFTGTVALATVQAPLQGVWIVISVMLGLSGIGASISEGQFVTATIFVSFAFLVTVIFAIKAIPAAAKILFAVFFIGVCALLLGDQTARHAMAGSMPYTLYYGDSRIAGNLLRAGDKADRMFVVGAYVARPRYATSEGCVG
jgi:hypothetical protein